MVQFSYSFSPKKEGKGQFCIIISTTTNKKRTLDSWSVEASFSIHFICCPISNNNNKSNTEKYCATKKHLSCKRIILHPNKERTGRDRENTMQLSIPTMNNITNGVVLLLFIATTTPWFCQVSHGLVVVQQQPQHQQRQSVVTNNCRMIQQRRSINNNSIGLQQQQQQSWQCTTITPTALASYSSDQQNNENVNDSNSNVLYSFGAEVVPEGQRPVNEYLDMKQAPLFGWGSNDVGLKGLVFRLGIVYTVVFLTVGFPIAGATYTSDGYLLPKIASANVGTLGLVLLVLVRIYSGWGYVGSRLQSKIIEYEETGWYDGNFEPKTEAELKRDQFLYKSDVQPAVDRLKLTTLAVAAFWVLSCAGLNAANSVKPKFDAYNPQVLNQVVKDEKFANAAAAASNDGRPTYCDSRYYRAIANGGQGCGN